MALQVSRITEACARMITSTLEALEWHTVRTLDGPISKECVLVTEAANPGSRADGNRKQRGSRTLTAINVGAL